MESASDTEGSSTSGQELSQDSELDPWEHRAAIAVNSYPVMLRHEQEVQRSQSGRQRAFQQCREDFQHHYDLQDAEDPSIVKKWEVHNLREWSLKKSGHYVTSVRNWIV